MANDIIIDSSEVDKKLDELKKALNTRFTGAKAGYLANDKGKKPYKEKDPPEIAKVALWNEYGTESIPARPFLRTAQLNAFPRAERLVQKRMEEGLDIEKICKQIGVMLQGEIKAQITRGTFTPNAPSTIRHKGSSRPLVDTGNLLQSVHWGISTNDGDIIVDKTK